MATRKRAAQAVKAVTDEAGLTTPEPLKQSPEELYRLVQEAAYEKAKARGFAPGGEVQDWLEAEAEVRQRIGGKDRWPHPAPPPNNA